MPTFSFRGYNTQGQKVGGSLRCTTRAQMEEIIGKEGITGYQIFESKTVYRNKPYALVSPSELAVFCREMSVVLSSPLTVMEGLILLSEQTENEQLRITLNEVYRHMSRGFTFAGSICMYDHVFGAYLLNMITVGEMTGALGSVFVKMTEYFDREARVRRRLSTAITYPLIRLALMGLVFCLLLGQVIPLFENMYSAFSYTRPGVTGAVFVVGRFFNQHVAWVALFAALIAVIYYILEHLPKGRLWVDKQKLTRPVLRNIYQYLCAARFTRGLSIMLKHGVTFANTIIYMQNLIDNQYLGTQLRKALQLLQEGAVPPVAFENVKELPPAFLRMLLIGHDTGRMDEMMERAADLFLEETYRAINKTTVLIEPGLMLTLAAAAALILLAVIAPMTRVITVIGV